MKNNIAVIVVLVLVFPVLCRAQLVNTAPAVDPVVSAKNTVDLLSKEDFQGAMKNFDANMKAGLSLEKLQEIWKSLIEQKGAFVQQLAVHAGKFQQYDVVFVTCQFEKSTLDVKVVLNSSGEISGLFFVPSQQAPTPYTPPGYVKQSSIADKNVVVGKGKWALPGALTLPAGQGPFKAVVLVHGSGPHDRDETIGPNKPFRDLAWGLASQGIAVLRYEKRTRQYAESLSAQNLTVKEETIDDAVAAVALLRKAPNIDPHKIFVLGHSLGGMLIPKIGTQDPSIAGFIIMAGTNRRLEDVIVEQISYILSLKATMSDSDRAQLNEFKREAANVKSAKLSAKTPSKDLPLGIPAKYWLDLRKYNPLTTVKSLQQPILVLQGERDYQVTMVDFNGWKDALSSRSNVEFHSYPKLNHLFIEGDGKSTPDEYMKEGHISEQVIFDIARWLQNH